MDRLLLTLIASVCFILGQAQPGDALNRTDAQGRKQGAWAKSWDNGKLRYQGQFKDDKPQGEFRHFDEKGNLHTVQRYDPDGLISRAEHYHPDGSLMATGRYLGQEKDSTWNYYDENGKLRKVEQLVKGKLHGEQVTYYPNGMVAERTNYDNGIIHGPSKTWFANGNISSEATYVKGVPEGKMVHYHSNGKKELEGNMVKGQRDGTWVHLAADGSLHMRLVYRNGDLTREIRENGIFKEYYPDEQVKSEVTYKKGKKEGPFTEYHDNGTWVVKQMPADMATGARSDMERVLQGQTKMREGKYVDDKLEGEVKEYDERGRLVKVLTYEAGVVKGEQVKR